MKTHLVSAVVSLLMLAGMGWAEGEDPHAAWDAILQKRVDDAGQVDYRGLRQDGAAMDAYLLWIARTDPSTLTRDGQMAYWVNAYNAFTAKLILNHYPVKSIKDIPKRWDLEIWEAGGLRYSLNHIEHEILRKKFKDARVHFAIVCASVGCPDLWNHAFSEAALAEQLDDAARKFFRSPKHLRFETKKGAFGREVSTLHLSSILKWFSDDFAEGGKTDITRFVARYADRELVKKMFKTGDALKVKYLAYDWDLNENP